MWLTTLVPFILLPNLPRLHLSLHPSLPPCRSVSLSSAFSCKICPQYLSCISSLASVPDSPCPTPSPLHHTFPPSPPLLSLPPSPPLLPYLQVRQPFLHPALQEFALGLSKAELFGEERSEEWWGFNEGNLLLRMAFPEVISARRPKEPIEVSRAGVICHWASFAIGCHLPSDVICHRVGSSASSSSPSHSTSEYRGSTS